MCPARAEEPKRNKNSNSAAENPWKRTKGLVDGSNFRAASCEGLSALVMAVCMLQDLVVMHAHDLLASNVGRHRKTPFFRAGHPVEPPVAATLTCEVMSVPFNLGHDRAQLIACCSGDDTTLDPAHADAARMADELARMTFKAIGELVFREVCDQTAPASATVAATKVPSLVHGKRVDWQKIGTRHCHGDSGRREAAKTKQDEGTGNAVTIVATSTAFLECLQDEASCRWVPMSMRFRGTSRQVPRSVITQCVCNSQFNYNLII